jgi:hypothetical protein
MFAASPIKTAIAALALTLPMLAHADAAQDAAAKELAQVIGLNNMPNDLANRTTASAGPLLQEYLVKNKVNLSPEQQRKPRTASRPMPMACTRPPLTISTLPP